MLKATVKKIHNKNTQKYEPLRISGIFFIIGISGVLISEKLAEKLVSDKDILNNINTYKDGMYIFIISVILYILIAHLMKKDNLISNKLIENERRWKKSQAIGNVGNWEVDLLTNKVWASEHALKLYGLTSKDGTFLLEDVQKLVVEEDRAKLDNAIMLLLTKKMRYDVEFRIQSTDTKSEKYMHSVAELEYDAKGKPIRVLGVIQETTVRKNYEIKLLSTNEELSSLYEELAASEEELRQQIDDIMSNKELLELSEERYKTLVNNSQDIIYSCDNNGVFVTVNDRFSQITNIPTNKIIGKKMSDIVSKSAFNELWESNISKIVNSGETLYLENRYSEDIVFNVTLSPIFNNKNKVVGVTGTNHNISEFKKSEEIIKHMAFYDDLTGLPNRIFFFRELKDEIEISKLEGNKMVILFLDMDNFKRINDSLGHAFGDELLKEASKRLKDCMRECDTIARISGDEFSVLIKDIESTNESLPIINKILKVFGDPFNIGNSSINMTSSIGASVFPTDGEQAEDLIRSSDIAMYKAKELGGNCYKFFNISMKNELLKKLNIEVMLRRGIIEEEFILNYQPQFEANTKILRGFEALIRWNSKELGFLSPLEFIPIAEETGLISTIGEWVLNCACNFAYKINKDYGKNVIIAVNISPIQLKQIDFYDIVTNAIEKSGINPANLELEVTENIFINNFDFALKILNDLKAYGVRIALDDFGTGYSSLSYLKKLPIDILKIDKSFIDEINESNSKNDFIDAIITLVHKLKIETIAEGVENEFQYNYLVNAEADLVQGFYLGRPLPEAEIEKLLTSQYKI
ncbi:MAG TPA: EAL domain-containing protein [Clostridiaceae bacterium]